MMNKKFVVLLLTCLLSLVSVSAAPLNLVNDGKSTFTIVMPMQSHKATWRAAIEIRTIVEAASGARLSIKKTDVIDPNASNIISLGSTRQAAAAGISAKDIPDEGFRIVTRGKNIYIVGPDTLETERTKDGGTSTGTANGVYTFLEDYLNARWLMPGDLGRDVPKTSSITIPEINRTEAPAFNLRELPYTYEHLRTVQDWQEAQKVRYESMNFYYQHSWSKIVLPSLYEKHPDWFALVNGSRKPIGTNYKLETTNQELVRYFADQVIAKLKADPKLVAYSLSPTDLAGWSESPESKALYDPVPAGSKSGRPSVTPLVLKFYHDVAQIVAQEYPQGRVSGYIYHDYLFPPQQGSMKLPENFIPVIAPSIDYGFRLYQKNTQETFTKLMDGWSKVVPTDWYFYDLPNTWMDAGQASHFQEGSTGLVMPPGTRILDFIFPQLVKHHIRGARIYGNQSWSNTALGNYILAKMMWNPRLKASELQTEWLTRAYGADAGTVMNQFYQKLEAAFESYSQKEAINFRIEDSYLEGIYGAHYAELEKVLLEAKACPMTELQRKRFELIEDNFIVLQWRLRNLGYLKSTFESPLQRTDAQIAAIINKPGVGFPRFPALVKKYERRVPDIKVQAGQITKPQSATRPPSFMLPETYLFYASQDGTLHLTCEEAVHGSYFAYYQIRTTTHRRVLDKGVLYAGADISVPVEAGTGYYLTIPANQGIGYRITIHGAALAEGGMQKDVLYLYGKDAQLRVMSVSKSSVSMQEGNGSVTIIKSLPDLGTAGLGKIQLQNKYKNIQLTELLDSKWNFQTDAKDDGYQAGFAQLELNDASWKSIDATDWWQNQGFAGYRGTAWYRKKVMTGDFVDDQKVLLYLGAIDGNAEIYVNERKAAEHLIGTKAQGYSGWDSPITIDMTPYMKAGENVIAIKVTSKEVGSSGIYKGAALFVAETK